MSQPVAQSTDTPPVIHTATITRDQARAAVDCLGNRISEFQNAAYQRGVAVDDMERDTDAYEAAREADEAARRACYDELERVRELLVGVVVERDRAAARAMPTLGPIGGASL